MDQLTARQDADPNMDRRREGLNEARPHRARQAVRWPIVPGKARRHADHSVARWPVDLMPPWHVVHSADRNEVPWPVDSTADRWLAALMAPWLAAPSADHNEARWPVDPNVAE